MMNFRILFLLIVGSLLSELTICSVRETLIEENAGEEQLTRRRRDTSGGSSYFYYQQREYPRDCQEIYDRCDDQAAASGVFMIQPDGAPKPFKVYCNNSIDGGGWTVFQRRIDGSVYFYRNWNEYKVGFGFLNREFWLGNDNLAYLTAQEDYELRIDLNNVNGDPFFAKYSLFRISDERSLYRMLNLGEYLPESTANSDAMNYHRNMSFTTYDRDNDRHSSYNCAEYCRGAWWYKSCGSDLNRNYFDCPGCWRSIEWNTLPGGRYNIQYTEMKVRPLRES